MNSLLHSGSIRTGRLSSSERSFISEVILMLGGFVPWPRELQQEYVERGYWQELTIGEMLDRSADHFANREALVHEDLRITYADLKGRADRLATHMLNMGLRAGDVVIVQLPNIPEFVFTYFACVKIGVVPVMCLAQHREHEISYIADPVSYTHLRAHETVLDIVCRLLL